MVSPRIESAAYFSAVINLNELFKDCESIKLFILRSVLCKLMETALNALNLEQLTTHQIFFQ
jgi:hypothetical protein